MLDELCNAINQAGYECERVWEEGDKLMVFLPNCYTVIFSHSEKEDLLNFIIDKMYPVERTIEDLFIGLTKPDKVLEIVELMYFYIKSQIKTEKLTMDLMFKEYCHD